MTFSTQQTLMLLGLPGVGPATFWKIHEQFQACDFQSIEQFFVSAKHVERLPEAAQTQIRQYLENPNTCKLTSRVSREMENAQSHGAEILTPDNPAFPSLLKQTAQCPPLIYVKGNLDALELPQIAVVGSRNASRAGSQAAFDFAYELAKNGFAITSGLAIGVDAAAHHAALEAEGTTVGVVGTGLDQMYPSANAALADEILNRNGAIVSEFPFGTKAAPSHFPRRNRIISGLSCGTLVIEAALKSGSLITARHAMEENREVFAIPGALNNPMARGCHALIKQGAHLVESSADIVVHLESFLTYKREQLAELATSQRKPIQQPLLIELSEEQQQVYQHVDYGPMSVDAIIEVSKLDSARVITVLLELELSGVIELGATGYVRT